MDYALMVTILLYSNSYFIKSFHKAIRMTVNDSKTNFSKTNYSKTNCIHTRMKPVLAHGRTTDLSKQCVYVSCLVQGHRQPM